MAKKTRNPEEALEEILERVTARLDDMAKDGKLHSREVVETLESYRAALDEHRKAEKALNEKIKNDLKSKAKGRTLSSNEIEGLQNFEKEFATLKGEMMRNRGFIMDGLKTHTLDELKAYESAMEKNILAMQKLYENAEAVHGKNSDVMKVINEFTKQDSAITSGQLGAQFKAGLGLTESQIENINGLTDEQAKIHEHILEIQELESIELGKQLKEEREFQRALGEREKTYQRIQQILRKVGNTAVSIAKQWMVFNDQAIADSKRLGITSRETAQAYTKSLMANTKELARDFGMAQEQAQKMQETFLKTTGRAAILTQNQMKDIAAASKLMGEENVQGAIQAMDSMGASSEKAMELMDQNYARAVNSGLDTVKASETFVKNLSLANQLSFKNGVDGISRMTTLSQRIKMDFQEVAKVADKFGTIEGAIEGSAQLQMLGGAGMMYGSNPMAMMYEALSDPEALFERMGKMFGEQARFDRRTGEAKIDPMQLQIMKEQAKAMGMNPDEAIKSAKQQARIADIAGSNATLFNTLNDEQKAKIENIAHFDTATQQWRVNFLDRNGQQQDREVRNLTREEIEAIGKDNIEPVEDIRMHVRKIASNLVSMNERAESMKAQKNAAVAEASNSIMTTGDDLLTGVNQDGFGSNLWRGMTDGGWGTWGTVGAQLLGSGLSIWYGNKLKKAILKHGLKATTEASKPLASNVVSTGAQEAAGASQGAVTTGAQSAAGTGTGAGATSGSLSTKAILGSKAAFGAGAVASIVAGGMYWYKQNKLANAYHDALSSGNENLSSQLADDDFNKGRVKDITAYRLGRQESIEHATDLRKGEAIGGGLGIAGAGTLGAAIGTAILPGIGTAVGAGIGMLVGWYGGKKVGRGMATGGENQTLEGAELDRINDDDADENIRRIVLPVESIDYNVSLIANQLGVLSAKPAMNNIYWDMEAEAAKKGKSTVVTAASNAISSSQINHTENTNTNTNQNLNTKVETKITLSGEIKLSGNGAMGKISSQEFMKLLEDSDFRSKFMKVISDNLKNAQTVGKNDRG